MICSAWPCFEAFLVGFPDPAVETYVILQNAFWTNNWRLEYAANLYLLVYYLDICDRKRIYIVSKNNIVSLVTFACLMVETRPPNYINIGKNISPTKKCTRGLFQPAGFEGSSRGLFFRVYYLTRWHVKEETISLLFLNLKKNLKNRMSTRQLKKLNLQPLQKSTQWF